MSEYVIVERSKLPANVVPRCTVTEDLVVVIEQASKLNVGRQVLVGLFEWFLGIIKELYKENGIDYTGAPIDDSFFELLTRATKFGIRAWMSYEEIFADMTPEEGSDVAEIGS